MGILLCCFRSPIDDEHEDSNVNEENQEFNVTTNTLLEDLANECDSLLGRGGMEPGDDNGLINRSEVEPEMVDEIAPLGLNLLVQELKNKCDTVLGQAVMGLEDEVGLHSQEELEVVSESSRLITHNSMLTDENYILSRDDECPVCFEEYTNDHPRIITKCSHHYHLNCLYQWQEVSGLCPQCSRVAEFDELD